MAGSGVLCGPALGEQDSGALPVTDVGRPQHPRSLRTATRVTDWRGHPLPHCHTVRAGTARNVSVQSLSLFLSVSLSLSLFDSLCLSLLLSVSLSLSLPLPLQPPSPSSFLLREPSGKGTLFTQETASEPPLRVTRAGCLPSAQREALQSRSQEGVRGGMQCWGPQCSHGRAAPSRQNRLLLLPSPPAREDPGDRTALLGWGAARSWALTSASF